jgi:transcriptional regulator with XRE-family HTH domain
MKVSRKTVGRRIAEQRRLAGFSQARLAERLNVSTETISRLETASAMPSIERLASIADALDVELAQLFRQRKADDPRDRAIDRLIWQMSRRTVGDVELVIDLAARIFGHRG